jgi:RiboL-PSP-HEPN
MNLHEAVKPFRDGLLELESIVQEAEREVIGNRETSPLFEKNVNFFTKSFLISACAHLEMCIKGIVFEVAKDIDARLLSASVPSSFIDWRYGQKKRNDSASELMRFISVNMTAKEIDDLVSGNVYKTKNALAIVGVEPESENDEWESWKESVQAIVTRRNNIVHHNDDASDVSLGDIRNFIKTILDYINFIISVCIK